MTRPSACLTPLLTLSVPAPFPIPHDSTSPPPVLLHIEYREIDVESDHTGTPKETGIVQKSYDASTLTKSTSLQIEIDNLPHMVLPWDAYVVRVRLQILEEVNEKWSSYSQPFCVHCQECELYCEVPHIPLQYTGHTLFHNQPCV